VQGDSLAQNDELGRLRQQVAALRTEIAESRAREQALVESEARYRILTEDTLVGVYVIQDGKFAYLNRPAARIWDAEPEELVGREVRQLVTPESMPTVEENIRRRLAGELERAQYRVKVRGPHGQAREIEVLGCPVTYGGRPAILGTAIDRTEEVRTHEALAEQSRLFQLILDSIGDGVAATNERGEFVIFNPAARRITGLGPRGVTPAEWTAHYGVFEPDGVTPFKPEKLPLARAMRGESSDAVEMCLRNQHTPEGTFIRVSGRPLIDEHGTRHGGVVVFHDTTQRRHMFEQLGRAEAKYRALVEQLPVVTYTSTAEPMGALFYVSPQIEPLLGFTPAEWIADGDLWMRQLHPEDRDRVLREVEHSWATGAKFVSEYRMFSRRGGVVWFHDEAVIIPDTEGRASLMQGVMVDVTERETERIGRKRMQALSLDLVTVQEAERRRLGLELHDDIGQVLTGLKIILGTAGSLSLDDSRRKLAEAEQLVEEATQRVRELSQQLRPAVLDDLGLLPALVSHLGTFTRQTSIRVDFEHHGVERRRFGPDLETAAYRIVQEALTNVARHARVKDVKVQAWAEDGLLCLLVEDHGAGFDGTHAAGGSAIRGIGGMRERAALLGGRVTLESTPGQGCKLTAELPIVDVPEWR